MIMFEISVIVVRWVGSRMFSRRVVGRARRGAGDIVLALSACRRRRAPKNTTLGAQRAVWPSRDPGRSHSSSFKNPPAAVIHQRF